MWIGMGKDTIMHYRIPYFDILYGVDIIYGRRNKNTYAFIGMYNFWILIV